MAVQEKLLSIKIQTEAETKTIAGLQKNLVLLTKRRNELNKKIRDGIGLTKGEEKELGKLQSELVGTRNRLRDMERQVVKNNNALKKNSGFVAGVRKGMGQMVTSVSGAVLAFAAIGQVISNVTKIVADFDQAQANLRAITGKTKGELEGLTNQAKELGASTAFTATQATEAQTELAKLGFTVNEITQLTPAVLNLASATGTDLAEAATVAGATVRGFGLSADQTQRVVDVMANSFTKSALDMEKFSTAMATVAPVANSAGVSIEETTALLGTLVNAGVDASTAGTGLRNVFLDLSKSGMTFEEAMQEINTSSNKNATAFELFGKRGATVGTILATTSSEARKLTKDLEDSAGAAQKMADEQLNTLTGKLTILNSAWEGLVLTVEDGDEAIGTFVRGSLDFVTKGITQLANLSAMTEVIFRGVEDASEDSVKAMIKNADALNVTLSSGMKLNDFLKEFDDLTLEELNGDLEHNRIMFLRAAEAQEEGTEEAVAIWNAYINLRNESEAVAEETAKVNEEVNGLVETLEKEAKETRDLIKLKQEEIKLLQETDATTQSEIERRNIKVQILQDELKVLQQLGLQREEDLAQMEMISSTETEIEVQQQEKKLALKSEQQIRYEEETAKKSEFVAQNLAKKQISIEEDRRKTISASITAIGDVAAETQNLISTNFESARLAEVAAAGDNQEKIAEINKKYAKKQQNLSAIQAAINGALAVTSALATVQPTVPAGVIAAASAAATTALQVAAIKSQKFQKGGMLNGPSHAEGGIPFSVGGRVGFEAEGGEAIINKKSTAMFGPLLSAINQAGGGVAFEQGGKLFASGGVPTSTRTGSVSVESMENSIADLGSVMQEVVNTIEVVNVATNTTAVSNEVINIESEASF